jgi:hypothetical protein
MAVETAEPRFRSLSLDGGALPKRLLIFLFHLKRMI